MTIDTSGKWWKGSEPSDMAEYIHALSEESYPIDEFRISACTCGEKVFALEWIEDEGAAKRICIACGTPNFICDSEENWEGKPRKFKCSCGAKAANVGVGFSLSEDRSDVRWVYVGVMCASCGILSCVGDWKIGYEPSLQLLDQV